MIYFLSKDIIIIYILNVVDIEINISSNFKNLELKMIKFTQHDYQVIVVGSDNPIGYSRTCLKQYCLIQ